MPFTAVKTILKSPSPAVTLSETLLVETTGVSFKILMLKSLLVVPISFLAEASNLNVPAYLGVPEIFPAFENTRPSGRSPLVFSHVAGADELFAIKS